MNNWLICFIIACCWFFLAVMAPNELMMYSRLIMSQIFVVACFIIAEVKNDRR